MCFWFISTDEITFFFRIRCTLVTFAPMMGWLEVLVLLFSGFAVGFINTVAGGATVISLAALMVLGLPLSVANATHRIAAMFQTAASTGIYLKQKVLHAGTGIRLSIPVIIGSLIGAWFAITIDEEIFGMLAGGALVLMLLALILKPGIWTEGKISTPVIQPRPWQYVLFFLIGVYGGLIYIGIGYFLLAGLVLGTRLDLVRANALKVFIVLLYVPFTLILFILSDLIYWPYALVISVGQAAGAWIAARATIRVGNGLIRWFMIVFILLTLAELFNVTDLKGLISLSMNPL